MDRLFSMEVFVASVDLGSFTAAANVFKITPAMVSKHILSLEKRLERHYWLEQLARRS